MTEQYLPWQRIIWGEINHARDPEYAEYLYLAVNNGYLRWVNRLSHWVRPRASAREVESALYFLADELEWSGADIWAKNLRRLEREQNGEVPVEQLIIDLMDYHWLRRFLARHVLFFRGGEAIARLNKISSPAEVQKTALWLMRSISSDTTQRLHQQTEKWICHICFLRCKRHQVNRAGVDLPYYGCRGCARSWGLLHIERDIVCCLASRETPLHQEDQGDLYVNWTRHQALFDFDWIWLKQADDETVERFAVDVGNDLDPKRRSNVSRMLCVVEPNLDLSLNTLRILESMFGRIEHHA